MQIPVVIYGSSGRVGSQLAKYIQDLDNPPFRVVGMVEHSSHILDRSGVLETQFTVSLRAGTCTIDDVLTTMGDTPGIIVDCTAAKDPLRDIHLHVIKQTLHSIVTANKNPLSLYSHDVFMDLTRDRKRYSSDTTVMAGTGVIPFIQDRVATGDKVMKIRGMFSGTLGYIFSSFENGDKTFSEVIREAYRLGYTEPHPYDDLNGLDVARKLLILARYLGNEAQLSDISLQPLVPEDLYDGDVETFLNNCASLDEKYEEHKNRAAASGETLRYVDEYDRETGLTVGLASVPKSSALGQLAGTHNIADIQTDSYGAPYPHIIQSRGAGLEVTAYSLLAQILRVCDTLLSGKT